MADITMCTNNLCPKATLCYRNQAKPSEWQSWAFFEYKISSQGCVCEHYMPIYDAGITLTT